MQFCLHEKLLYKSNSFLYETKNIAIFAVNKNQNTNSFMETILFIAFCILIAVFVAVLIGCIRIERKQSRALDAQLIQLELDTEHLFHEVQALNSEFALLKEHLQGLELEWESAKEQPKPAKMIIVGTTVGVSKERLEKAAQKAAEKKETEQSSEKKTTATFAAMHRKQYLDLRKQGLSIREAAKKAGVSHTTACRYEQWGKRNPNDLLKK